MKHYQIAIHVCLCAASLMTQMIFAQSGTHRFSSDFGFELKYPGDWTPNVLGQVPPMTAKDLDSQALQDPQRRGIECNQKVFFTKQGNPPSNFVGGAQTLSCTGQLPTIEAFASRTVVFVRNNYKLVTLEIGDYSVNGQKFWLLRATGESQRIANGPVVIEYVATVIPQGLVYWSVEAHSDRAKADFEHTLLRLNSGTETELIPANTHFTALAQPVNRPGTKTNASSGNAVTPDYKASHHFDSGLGFVYEVPQDLTILNAKRFEAEVKSVANQQTTTKAEVKSIECGHQLLVAENHSETKIVVITGHRQECIGFSLGADNLSRIGVYGMEELNKRFVLSNTETTLSSIGSHATWLMESEILPNNPVNPNRFMAMMITPTIEGMIEILIQAKTRTDLNTLMATRIKFDDDSESEIVPATSFVKK